MADQLKIKSGSKMQVAFDVPPGKEPNFNMVCTFNKSLDASAFLMSIPMVNGKALPLDENQKLLIRYGGVPRYSGYCGWIAEDVPEKERPLLWADQSHRAKLNRNYRFIYNEAEKNFDLMDMKTEKRIGTFYAKK